MANHGPSYGLTKEVEEKNAARFNLKEAQETLVWIADCIQEPFDADPTSFTTEQEVGDALKNGIKLCRLAETLSGSSLKYSKKASMPFHMMVNIDTFLTAIRAYGVPEISTFQTVDLYEMKQMYKVVECLRSLAAVAQKHNAPVSFPPWVVRLSDKKPRQFSEEQLQQGKTVISLQMGSNSGASQAGMRPYGAGRQIVD